MLGEIDAVFARASSCPRVGRPDVMMLQAGQRAVVPDPVARKRDGGSAGWIAVDADGGRCRIRVRPRGNVRSSLAEGQGTLGNGKKGGAAACEVEDLNRRAVDRVLLAAAIWFPCPALRSVDDRGGTPASTVSAR